MNEEKQEHFMRDLRKLLNFHGAEITADAHWRGYAECGQDIRMTVEFDDWSVPNIALGKWINKNTAIANANCEPQVVSTSTTNGSIDYSICHNNLCSAPHHNCPVAVICWGFVAHSHEKSKNAARHNDQIGGGTPSAESDC